MIGLGTYNDSHIHINNYVHTIVFLFHACMVHRLNSSFTRCCRILYVKSKIM